MSFLKLCRSFGTFVTYMVEEKEISLMFIKMKNLRLSTTIKDIYNFLQYLEEKKPFKDTYQVAEIVDLQLHFLTKCRYPSLIEVDGKQEPKWTVLKEFSSYNSSTLTVRVTTNHGGIFDFVVRNKIQVFEIDSNYCRSSRPIGECDNADHAFDMIFDEVEAVMEENIEAVMEDEDEDEVEAVIKKEIEKLKELPFKFTRRVK